MKNEWEYLKIAINKTDVRREQFFHTFQEREAEVLCIKTEVLA